MVLIEGIHFQVPEGLGLSFKNMTELNKIIDNHLPGHPRFQRHEIIVGDKVCEVYFRDIIACIRALFGDPSFALYLIFEPEKHYTDDEKTIWLYHDMHTGRWWWSMQVRVQCKVDIDKSRSHAELLL